MTVLINTVQWKDLYMTHWLSDSSNSFVIKQRIIILDEYGSTNLLNFAFSSLPFTTPASCHTPTTRTTSEAWLTTSSIQRNPWNPWDFWDPFQKNGWGKTRSSGVHIHTSHPIISLFWSNWQCTQRGIIMSMEEEGRDNYISIKGSFDRRNQYLKQRGIFCENSSDIRIRYLEVIFHKEQQCLKSQKVFFSQKCL